MVKRAESVAKVMGEGKLPEMVYVVISGAVPTGHHAFTDSVNNGPWGRAFVEELIPFIEKNYRTGGRPNARLLTGHSSGGWASLWLQMTYPDFFGGTWSTSPDPVDFRSFSGVDVTPGSKVSFYRDENGKPRELVRIGDRWVWSMERFDRFEDVLGDHGGALKTFEWVFSPRGEDGAPMQLYDRHTGELNEATMRAWEKFDIRKQLESRWTELGPKLKTKLHIFCGAQDNFRLEEATGRLCDALKRLGSDATCEVVPGKDHFSVRTQDLADPAGLSYRIAKEMEATAARK
jgi:pimeloyl-ACP methyl ester carboxylesterase